jgi:hypothetical protein
VTVSRRNALLHGCAVCAGVIATQIPGVVPLAQAQDQRRGSQNGWRWCRKCQGMFWGSPNSVCPADSLVHDDSQSGHYAAVEGDRGGSRIYQGDWRWCQKCHVMFFSGNRSQGNCPADSRSHDGSQSGHYVAAWGDGNQYFQGGWRWCRKCQGMFFGGNRSQVSAPATN